MSRLKETLGIAAIAISFNSFGINPQSPKEVFNPGFCIESIDHLQKLYRPDLKIPEAVLKSNSPIPLNTSYQMPDGKIYLNTPFGIVLSSYVLPGPCDELKNINSAEMESMNEEDITSLNIVPLVAKINSNQDAEWDELPHSPNTLYLLAYPAPYQDYFPSYLFLAHNYTDTGKKIARWYKDESAIVRATFFPNKTRVYFLEKYGRYLNADALPFIKGEKQILLKTTDPEDGNYALYLRAIEVVPNN